MKILKNGDMAFFQPKSIVLVGLGIGWVMQFIIFSLVSYQNKQLLGMMMVVVAVTFVITVIAILVLSKNFNRQRFIVSSQGVQFPGKGKVCMNWDQIKTIHYEKRETCINGITRQSELFVFDTDQAVPQEWDLMGISRQDRRLLLQLFEEHNLAVKGLD